MAAIPPSPRATILLVRVIEARNVPVMDQNGSADTYVKLKVGNQRFKTKVIKKCLTPSWFEEFSFKVEDLKEQLVFTLLNEDKYFNDDVIGSVKIPVARVFDSDEKSLGTLWYPLQPKKRSKIKECGEVLLTICFSQNNSPCDMQSQVENGTMSPSRSSTSSIMSSPLRQEEVAPVKEEKSSREKLSNLLSHIFNRNNELIPPAASNKITELPEITETDDSEVSEDKSEEQSTSSSNFEELMKKMEEKDEGNEMPSNLPGGVMLDQMLIKALKAIEDQTYLKADGKCFSVLASVNTPDAPYASNYRVEIQTSISPGPELPSGEETSHLVVSWRMNFLHNTMMKGMIEGGARQGVKESFEQVATLLAEKLKVVDIKDVGSEKDQALASLQVEKQSDWKLAVQYFCNFTVISTIFMGLYVLVHLFLAMPNTIQGLEFGGLDLPDSIGEVVAVSWSSMHKWMVGCLTVALVEGSNLPAVESNALSDPYVVFTCNGKARTSSIKFQKSDPRWNEIFEFDAMDDPPSTLDVEVYDFDGPFDEAVSLGHTQINFVKTNISDLGDAWVPLEGKLAQACQSKIRILRSSLSFHPKKEFNNDFTCHLKRKMPLQGRLFLSARIIGFHGDLFGHKTTFFFLWEDIEDIQVVPPTLSSMGSPIVVITLHPGRGLDAKHGAKTQDAEGRLKFHFQSFVSFSVAHR
ncbi:C2 and GRAM domain-containing protein [Tanacetum coccineum]